MRITMTAVTALLALALAGCSSDHERVEENSTVTLGDLGVSFVVPTGYRDADEALVRAQAAAELARSDDAEHPTGKAGQKKDAKESTKKGAPSIAAAAAALTSAELQKLVAQFDVFLVDSATEGSANPSVVFALAQPFPLTTGTGSAVQTGLEAAKGVSSVDVMTQATKAGQTVRATYAITIGKDKDGDDIELYFQTIDLGLDDSSSVQITTSSMDEDVARDLADTVAASLAKV